MRKSRPRRTGRSTARDLKWKWPRLAPFAPPPRVSLRWLEPTSQDSERAPHRSTANRSEPNALTAALEISRFPQRATTMAHSAIPADIEDALRVAASWEACSAAAVGLGVTPSTLQLATRLYLKQVLLHDGADSHRILGIDAGATRETARRHFSLLLRWLHPDRNSGWDTAYAGRVVKAWREISRGIDPDEPARSPNQPSHRVAHASVRRDPRRARPERRKRGRRARGIRLLLLAAAGLGCIALGSAALFAN